MKNLQYYLGGLFFLFFFTMCRNDDSSDPTLLKLYVNYEGLGTVSGGGVANALVSIVCESSLVPAKPCDVNITGKTDKNGLFEYTFQESKVLRVKVFKLDTTITTTGIPPRTIRKIDSLCGDSYVSIKLNETQVKTVILYDNCNTR